MVGSSAGVSAGGGEGGAVVVLAPFGRGRRFSLGPGRRGRAPAVAVSRALGLAVVDEASASSDGPSSSTGAAVVEMRPRVLYLFPPPDWKLLGLALVLDCVASVVGAAVVAPEDPLRRP